MYVNYEQGEKLRRFSGSEQIDFKDRVSDALRLAGEQSGGGNLVDDSQENDYVDSKNDSQELEFEPDRKLGGNPQRSANNAEYWSTVSLYEQDNNKEYDEEKRVIFNVDNKENYNNKQQYKNEVDMKSIDIKLQEASEQKQKDFPRTIYGTNHIACTKTVRPKPEEIQITTQRWQYFKEGDTIYIYQAVYYDNRYRQMNLKVFPIVGRPKGKVPADEYVFAHLWYEKLIHPLVIPVQQSRSSWRRERYTNNTQVGQALQYIQLPTSENGSVLVPQFVSFAKHRCPDRVQSYVPVVVPSPVQKDPKGIILCHKLLYGNFTKHDLPYLVNWFEFLQLFGVTKVDIPYTHLLMDQHINNMFQYYQNIRLLTGFEYKPSNLFDDNVHENDAIAMVDVNDCLYKNLNQYKYLLHKDIDELMVPRKQQTYEEVIQEFLVQEGLEHLNQSGFRVWAALHYAFHPPGNPEQPEYMPILRTTLRQPTSIWRKNRKNPGGSKAISFMEHVVMQEVHSIKRALTAQEQRRIPEPAMLVHHFRNTCKRQSPTKCAREIHEAWRDDGIVKNFAHVITPRVESVLRKLGYL